jgi:hypothetical protein
VTVSSWRRQLLKLNKPRNLAQEHRSSLAAACGAGVSIGVSGDVQSSETYAPTYVQRAVCYSQWQVQCRLVDALLQVLLTLVLHRTHRCYCTE